VGCDRATASGDVANKIGTYLKALAAHDNGIPFYSAFPVSTFDMSIDRPDQIAIEERDGDEVRMIEGLIVASSLPETASVLISPAEMPVSNFGFDVTPARLLSGIITDRGICSAERESILKLLA
jgi:methylthioribose-1-phosphate isomerase